MRDSRSLGAALGAHLVERGTRFSAFATGATSCAVRLFDEARRPLSTHVMQAAGDDVFSCTLEGVAEGTLYKLVLDDRELPDPYARSLPFGVHGPAQVLRTHHAFRHPQVHRPLSEQVVYELHVGTFTDAGTYDAARARLPELRSLGITAIELMPVASFAGRRGWGYDGVALFAPFAPYGSPDALCAFVDEAHRLRLSVLLDVVYNHFGPAGSYLSAFSPAYFTREVQNAWGDAPDFTHPAMRSYVLDNAIMWLRDYRFDGLRLDAIHAIVDPSEKHVLRELRERIEATVGPRILIGEDDRNDPASIHALGLDAVWADDFHHQLRVTLTGERDGYYAAYTPSVEGVAAAIERGWLYEGQRYGPRGDPRGRPADSLAAHNFVYCIQNHDQIGNRALGERLLADVSLEAYCMASALLLFLPMTPLLFMGQEWAASSPFQYFTDHEPELGALVSKGRREEFKSFSAFSDEQRRASIPDPQAEATFARSRLRWAEREHAPHARVLALYRRLLDFRGSDPVMLHGAREALSARAHGSLLVVTRTLGVARRTLLASFSDRETEVADIPEAKGATVVLHTAEGPLSMRLGPYQALIVADTVKGACA